MTRREVPVAERRARLARRHHLAPAARTDDVVSITRDLVALHSSDPATVYLSTAARMEQPRWEPLERALYEERTLVRHHAMRRTLWVFDIDTARVAHAACTTALVANQRRTLIGVIEASGVAADGGAWLEMARAQVLAALDGRPPAAARELGAIVPELQAKLHLAVGKRYGASVAAHTRVLLLLGFEAALVRTRPTGSWINSEYRWAAMEYWVPGGLAGLEPAAARAELVRRWLWSFGPGTTADIQWWAGWTVGATKAALADAGAVAVTVDGEPAWLREDDLEPVADDSRWVALLPALDPTTMGWKRRDWYLDPAYTPLLFDGNGNAGPTVWLDGRVVGGWVQRRDGEIAVRLLDDVGARRRREVDAAATALRELLGPTRFSVRFPAPLQAELLA